MAYSVPEVSVDSGEPYFLYLFDNGITTHRLTTEPDTIERLSDSWYPSPISHGNIEQTGNIEKQELILTFPLADTLARSYLIPAAAITTVTIWRGHRDDVDEELRVYWKGRVTGAKDSERKIEVSVESIFTSLRRPGCRARFMRTCRHALYFEGCNLDRGDFEIPATVTWASGVTLTIPEAGGATPVQEYLGGTVNWNGLLGFIGNHVDTQITLTLPIVGLSKAVEDYGSRSVLIAPGCDRGEARCNDRFSNGLNHGGFHRLPSLNPFEINIK